MIWSSGSLIKFKKQHSDTMYYNNFSIFANRVIQLCLEIFVQNEHGISTIQSRSKSYKIRNLFLWVKMYMERTVVFTRFENVFCVLFLVVFTSCILDVPSPWHLFIEKDKVASYWSKEKKKESGLNVFSSRVSLIKWRSYNKG